MRVLMKKTGTGSPVIAPPVPASDPYWSNVALYMDFDHNIINKATGSNVNVQQPGSGGLYDTEKVFGTASLHTIGDTILQGPAFNPGTNEFTVEVWARSTSSTPVKRQIFGGDDFSTGIELIVDTDSKPTWNNGSGGIIKGTTTVAGDNEWHHFAVSRDISNTTRLFVDGILQMSMTDTESYIIGITGIASRGGNNSWYGQIDELRVTHDVARYTDNFTLPTEAYPTT